MANKKISELPTADTPLNDADLVEVVQGGINKKAPKSEFGSAVPDADASTKGIAKLYTAVGSNTDGSMTQNAVTGELLAILAALDLKADAQVTYRNLTSDHTLDSTDLASVEAGEALVIEMDLAIANDVTVPPNATIAFPIGTVIAVVQMGAGLTSIIAGVGVTINTSAGHLNSPGQNSPMSLVKKGTNTWYLFNGLPSSVATWQDWGASLTPAGFSAITTQKSRYQDDGQTVHFWVEIAGTSNSTGFTFSLPIALSSNYSAAGFMIACTITNGGNPVAGRLYASGSATTVTVETVTGGTLTATGAKGIKATFFYQK